MTGSEQDVNGTSNENDCLSITIRSLNGTTHLCISFDQPKPLIRLTRLSQPSDTYDDQIAENRPCVLSAQLLALGCHRSAVYTINSNVHTIAFRDTDSSITVTPTQHSFILTVTSASSSYVQVDFDLHPTSWFGLGHLMNHHWPLDKSALVLSPAYPFDNGPTGVSTVLDPTFVSSAGALLSFHDDSPCLHLAINSPYPPNSELVSPYQWTTGLGNLHRQILPESTPIATPRSLTVQSRTAFDHSHVAHPWSSPPSPSLSANASVKKPELSFSVSATTNVRDATLLSLSQLRAHYGAAPCTSAKIGMMKDPVWSTWAKFKQHIDQEKVLSFATQIVEQKLPRSVIGIDDCWSTGYGELRFDPLKFPSPAEMVRELHELGFMVTLWVTPFANVTCSPLTSAETRKYYVTMPNGDAGSFQWWQPGMAAALDVTNPDACEWFVGQLQALCDEYAIDGFKFDAGEPCFLPTGCTLFNELTSPNDYTRAWIHNVASKFPIAEVRSAVRGCQSAAPIFRIFDRYSTWGLENGLASVLTAVLTSGILGFPFCIPDYVAGNAYGDEIPNAELMIRWTQVSVAMPALQFSIPPWQFNDMCSAVVKDAIRWRELFFWTHIERCIQDASDKLWPIVRPMWWKEPELDGVTDIYDQFMVGDNVVVAPIIIQGQRERAVFLPRGLWRRVDLSVCKPDGDHITGPVWLEKVSAEVNDMPVYIAEQDDDHATYPLQL